MSFQTTHLSRDPPIKVKCACMCVAYLKKEKLDVIEYILTSSMSSHMLSVCRNTVLTFK